MKRKLKIASNAIMLLMQLVDKNISIDELKKMSNQAFGGLVKAVVDIEKQIMVVDADMHVDEEKYLLNTGSKQDNLWGINIYPDLQEENFIEFDSMINLRPRLNNFSRGVANKELQEKIMKVVNKLIIK